MKTWFKSGTPWIWLNAGAIAICMIMVTGLLGLIAVRGLSHFWPAAVLETTYSAPGQEPIRLLGSLSRSETVTAERVRGAGVEVPEDQLTVQRHLLKLGNKDSATGNPGLTDFGWFIEDRMSEWTYPEDALVLERMTWGNFYGYLRAVLEDGEPVAEGEAAWPELFSRVERAVALRDQIMRIERHDIGNISYRQERIRLAQRGIELRREALESRGQDTPELLAALDAEDEALQRQHEDLRSEFDEINKVRLQLRAEMDRDAVRAENASGRIVTIPMADVVRATRPNTMSFGNKVSEYFSRMHEFIFGYPREANTEGGILPPIVGTVTMVIIMSIIVTPIGILAAIYLREYAKQGPLVRLIRICVNNLAGVPSIVFGVFGLGFFVYFLGGNIDALFYPESLPSPTFGRPGMFWASLTLALLTLPVVIVATEEGLTRIPKSVREGSLALGATKAETIWRTIVPMAAPAMMTGLILAVARAAGEVAPLMLVGVVKLAPSLPVDSNPPYLHLDRSFMHLGFHIFDVGFQSPNVEAGRPLVYATALVLVFIIIVLNLAAVAIRNRLREKYKSDSD
ncbi:MAG: phosphate ABC transporter permease PstA [Phycisphaerales bacterium]